VQAKELAKHFDMMEPIETSAKDNTNIDEAFIKMAKVRAMFEGVFIHVSL
jgi:hypothetical protein